MMKHSLKALTAGAALVLATSGAWAQASNTANPQPTTNIAVEPQDAREATQKAVPRSDTGTLVRTDESAADRASDMAKDAKDEATPNTRRTTPSTTGNANPSEPRNSNATTGTVNNTTTPSSAMGISGTVPGAAATSGDATNTRNNPGTKVDGTRNTMDNNGTTMRNNRATRPARADRN